MNNETKRNGKIHVNILRNEWGEFEVPTPTPDFPESVYYAEDRDDAIDTCKLHWEANTTRREIVIRIKRGTYNRD